jgi:hypothetical protein
MPRDCRLLGAWQELPVLSPHGIVMVRVPAPERFAVHKLVVSQLRSTASAKLEKDLRQAATLIEALADRFPNAVQDALGGLPKSAVRYAVRAIKALERHLPSSKETPGKNEVAAGSMTGRDADLKSAARPSPSDHIAPPTEFCSRRTRSADTLHSGHLTV